MIDAIVEAYKQKDTINQISSQLHVADVQQFKDAVAVDVQQIHDILITILQSSSQTNMILSLEGDAAQSVINIIYYLQRHTRLSVLEHGSQAARLMGKLARRCYKLPQDLFISGITRISEYASGSGGYGEVFQAMFQGSRVALKRMRVFRGVDPSHVNAVRARALFCKEALVWQALRHKFIVPLLGIDTESFSPELCMVSPWMNNGTVVDFLHERNTTGKEKIYLVTRLLREITEGLAFLHEQQAIHGDLRGANILVNDQGQACLTDFGLTVLADFPFTDSSANIGGCERWKAPEAFQSGPDRRTTAIDIYALACVCYELYTGYKPFHEVPTRTVMMAVLARKRPTQPVDGSIPNGVWQLMMECWEHEPTDRPKIQAICEYFLELPTHPSEELSRNYRHLEWIPVMANIYPHLERGVNPHRMFDSLVDLGAQRNGARHMLGSVATHKSSATSKTQSDEVVSLQIIQVHPPDTAALCVIERELTLTINCEHILQIEALYLDLGSETLWVQRQHVPTSLSHIRIPTFSNPSIAALCIKDILLAFNYLRCKQISIKGIQLSDILITSSGSLKLTNLDTVLDSIDGEPVFKPILPGMLGNARANTSIAAIIWEMASGTRPLMDPLQHASPMTYKEFTQPYKDADDLDVLTAIISRRRPALREFFQMCFAHESFETLLNTQFIKDAAPRSALVELVNQVEERG
ncbi:Kinase-like protein [Mycena chlorophos]|uniref:Kinase-like protein n=1 Tax=Mycena chlorophos TaxID=658473 RepID=A0A8H6TPB3_MYCCL|nr:Kinase-like protein [Mycena chlorophos]